MALGIHVGLGGGQARIGDSRIGGCRLGLCVAQAKAGGVAGRDRTCAPLGIPAALLDVLGHHCQDGGPAFGVQAALARQAIGQGPCRVSGPSLKRSHELGLVNESKSNSAINPNRRSGSAFMEMLRAAASPSTRPGTQQHRKSRAGRASLRAILAWIRSRAYPRAPLQGDHLAAIALPAR